jgi:hypothetical protein
VSDPQELHPAVSVRFQVRVLGRRERREREQGGGVSGDGSGGELGRGDGDGRIGAGYGLIGRLDPGVGHVFIPRVGRYRDARIHHECCLKPVLRLPIAGDASKSRLAVPHRRNDSLRSLSRAELSRQQPEDIRSPVPFC